MITNEPNTVNSFYSNNAGLSQLDTPKPSIFNISTWSWFSWLIFFIILALLGFNVFIYLAKGSMTFIDFFMETISKIIAFFDMNNSSIPSSNEEPSSKLTKPTMYKIQPSKENSNETPTAITDQDEQNNVGTDNDIMNALKREKIEKLFPSEKSEAKTKAGARYREEGQEAGRPGQSEPERKKWDDDEPSYNADDSYSSIQMSKSSSKSGWCFIGEDRGFRSCIRVGENEKCMSGDIFPSEEICVNPNLRF